MSINIDYLREVARSRNIPESMVLKTPAAVMFLVASYNTKEEEFEAFGIEDDVKYDNIQDLNKLLDKLFEQSDAIDRENFQSMDVRQLATYVTVDDPNEIKRSPIVMSKFVTKLIKADKDKELIEQFIPSA